MTSPAHNEPQKLAYRIDEAVKASGLGRSFLYERMADGSLKSVKIGGRRLIMRDDLLRFLCGDIAVAGEVEAPTVKPKREPKPKSARRAGVVPFGQLELPWRR
ncbi:helix-turn-helix domain-containing protein [Asticcacaulis sp. DXS10W]|uniref:Helix-turn-helix domain-containing protein n=1 Tax=Asticcacaulis currens TaxID=2984210 RepID=A0ABT5IHA5_9CAUL|nr:helix-turn-helix domain-containing protein [Asticcacaulis currens]MDC7695587.1 helix-turn-helix domain-containing protein [Asticcacaulis currens]